MLRVAECHDICDNISVNNGLRYLIDRTITYIIGVVSPL
jgi:hypothetical protein